MNDCQVERIHQRTISECSYHFPIAPISSSSASICSANSTIRWSWCSPSWIAVKMKVKSVHLIDLYGQTDPPMRSQYAGVLRGDIWNCFDLRMRIFLSHHSWDSFALWPEFVVLFILWSFLVLVFFRPITKDSVQVMYNMICKRAFVCEFVFQ